MTNKTSSAPRYCRHKATEQAVVRLAGRDIYLGKYGTAASQEAYRRVIAEWTQHGGALPSEHHEFTVVELLAAYLRFAKTYYRKHGKPTSEISTLKRALATVKLLYGRELAANFGPRALKTVRQEMIDKGWVRSQINKQVDRVKRVFKWGVSEELIPGSVYEALRTVTGLRKGRSMAKESVPVKPVSEEDIEATLQHLSPIVSDMVQLQRLTGARPGEICELRPGDVNRSAEVWEYIPQSHKTEHHDQSRVIFIGPKAKEILLPYMLRPAESYCFSPVETDQRRRAEQHAERKTPLSCGNRPGTNRKSSPRRTPGQTYNTRSYGRAVRRAAKQAGVETWSPHRLRHSFATEVRKSHGLEAVQVCLGHANADMTQVYAERNFALAARVAAEVG